MSLVWTRTDPTRIQCEEYCLDVLSSGGFLRAQIRRDGCIDLYRYHNFPYPEKPDTSQMIDKIHICEIDDMINRLISLKFKAEEHWGKDWPL